MDANFASKRTFEGMEVSNKVGPARVLGWHINVRMKPKTEHLNKFSFVGPPRTVPISALVRVRLRTSNTHATQPSLLLWSVLSTFDVYPLCSPEGREAPRSTPQSQDTNQSP